MSTTNSDIKMSDNSLDEKHTWKILNDCFKKQGFVHMQIDSFNYYINQGIQSVIDDEPNIESIDSDGQKSIIKFGEVSLSDPGIIEEDRNLKLITPSEARNRDLYYDSSILCNINETVYKNGNIGYGRI